MRQTLVFSMLLLLFAEASFAESFWGRFGGGVFILGNNSTYVGEKPPESSWKRANGFGAGIEIDWAIKPDVLLTLQPMYVTGGGVIRFNVDETGTPILPDININTTYIDIPLLLKVTGTGRTRMYVSGGLTYGILVSAEREFQGNTEDIKDELESYNFAGNFGVGLELPIKSRYLFFEIRYTQGLRNIATGNFLADVPTSLEKPRLKTTSIELFAGFLL